MDSGWHLAQINVGRLVAPHSDPRVAGFFAELDRINALAEVSRGFIWRLKDEAGNATAIQTTPDPLFIINMSVWTDAETLFEFVYRTAHTPVMAQRQSWFERPAKAYQVLWWIEAGTVPAISDGLSKLWMIDNFGPSRHAFTFKARFPAPGIAGPAIDMQPDPWCAGRA
jgi:hypothetical protein